MIALRPYQEKAITSIFDWLYENEGNVCVEAPTGSGKSVLLAYFCKELLQRWPRLRILVLTHQKELIEQDARKMKEVWEDAEIGIYSASIGQKNLDMPITFAGIQSIIRTKQRVPLYHFILIDEAHLINNEETGSYRKFLDKQTGARVIGLTATPYRLGQGMVTDGGIFDAILPTVSILELQKAGYLSRLRSKGTEVVFDLSEVSIRGGEYAQESLDLAVNKKDINENVCKEIVASARFYGKEHWVIFCSSVNHAQEIAGELRELGIKAASIDGTMGKDQREELLWMFTHGEIQALTNVGILTTGFDYPEIDLIALLRPTTSPGLHAQILGRGLRLKKDGRDCLVLDFAGNVMRHGPVTDIIPPSKREKGGKGVAPCKECPKCLEIVPAQSHHCPSCGFEFPMSEREYTLYLGDVNGGGYVTKNVWGWQVMRRTSKSTGKEMFALEYKVGGGRVTEFLLVYHTGYAYNKSIALIKNLCSMTGVDFNSYRDGLGIDWDGLLMEISFGDPPSCIVTQKDGKYERIVERYWQKDIDEIEEKKRKMKEMADETRKHILS